MVWALKTYDSFRRIRGRAKVLSLFRICESFTWKNLELWRIGMGERVRERRELEIRGGSRGGALIGLGG